MEGLGYASIMIAAGIAIPAMAAMSGTLGRHLGSAPAATATLFAVALLIAVAATFATGAPAIAQFATAPRHLLLGGACVAFYALSITFIGPRFGVANAILCVLLGQMICSAAIDNFGLLGAPVVPISLTRILGIGLMAMGLFLARSNVVAPPA